MVMDHSKLYEITLIDTPGFGDGSPTFRKAQRNKFAVALKNAGFIDAILIVFSE